MRQRDLSSSDQVVHTGLHLRRASLVSLGRPRVTLGTLLGDLSRLKLDAFGTAQVLADGMRISYNFVRPPMVLGGNTPAQVAGLDLYSEGIRWLSLIKRAAIARKY